MSDPLRPARVFGLPWMLSVMPYLCGPKSICEDEHSMYLEESDSLCSSLL